VGERARYDPEQPERGVLTVVFVHGWKHNASAEDENVASFRKLLPKVAKMTPTRRVIGVYVGWRGLSIDWGDWLTNISYWDRKATAEQAHDYLQAQLPDERVHEAHVNLITHGRRTCHAQQPACGRCAIADRCRYVNPKAP